MLAPHVPVITPAHVERGQLIRAILTQEIGRGHTLEEATANVAAFLCVASETVSLAVAIANGVETGELLVGEAA